MPQRLLMIALLFRFVKNFFQVFQLFRSLIRCSVGLSRRSRKRLAYFTTLFPFCQHLFSDFFKIFSPTKKASATPFYFVPTLPQIQQLLCFTYCIMLFSVRQNFSPTALLPLTFSPWLCIIMNVIFIKLSKTKYAPVMELVDMRDLGSRAFSVWVRVPSGAPNAKSLLVFTWSRLFAFLLFMFCVQSFL